MKAIRKAIGPGDRHEPPGRRVPRRSTPRRPNMSAIQKTMQNKAQEQWTRTQKNPNRRATLP